MEIIIRSIMESGSTPRWNRFMNILEQCILKLGYDVRVIKCSGLYPDDPYPERFSIFPHCRIQEIPTGRLFYKEMYLKGLFTLDRLGWGPDHSRLKVAPDLTGVPEGKALELVKRLRRRYFINGDSKVPQPPGVTVPDSVKPYWLVPLQQEKDQVIKFHSSLSVVEFVHMIADWAEKKQRNIIYKLHPVDPTTEVAEAVKSRIRHSKFLHLNDGNIHCLIRNSLGVAVINSGTGFESLIHGKPVAVFGDCDYKWAGFMGTREGLDEIDDYFSGFGPEQKINTYRFIHYYIYQHAFETTGPVEEHVNDRITVVLRQAIDNYMNDSYKCDSSNRVPLPDLLPL